MMAILSSSKPKDLVVGQTILLTGYVTKAVYFRRQSAAEIERRIGYRAGRLTDGWWLCFALDIPSECDFEFRGYSQMSGGIPQGHLKSPPDKRTAEQRLIDDGFDLKRLKAKVIRDTFCVGGPERLAKVIPVKPGFGSEDYPAGTGIPQWEITTPNRIRFKVAAHIGPGEVYDGNYT